MKTLNVFYMTLSTVSTNVTGTTLALQLEGTGNSITLYGCYDKDSTEFQIITGISSQFKKTDVATTAGLYQYDISGIVKYKIEGTLAGAVFAKVMEE